MQDEERHYQQCGDESYCLSSANRQTDNLLDYAAEFHFIGATLQLRGVSPIDQPLIDTSKNILVYNGTWVMLSLGFYDLMLHILSSLFDICARFEFGFMWMLYLKGEVYGGLNVGSDENDTQILMQTLEKCCSCNSRWNDRICRCDERGKVSVVDVLSAIKGPWAVIYWQVTPGGKLLLVLVTTWCGICLCFLKVYYHLTFRRVQELCGLVEMHLAGGVSLHTGQRWKILGFCCLPCLPFLLLSRVLVNISR